MSDFDKDAHSTKWIAVKHLSVVWSSAQRELDQRRVDKIAAEFDPDLFDDLVVTGPDKSGTYHVVDGQHRRAAILQTYGEEEMVPCRVIEANDAKRAAAVFDKINNSRKAPTAVEQFLVRVTAGNDTETHIHCILDRLGLRVGHGPGRGVVRPVNALINVYKTYGSDVLAQAVQAIRETWGDDETAVAANILKGYASLIAEHRNSIDPKRLRESMAKEMTPGQLIGRARYHSELTKDSAAEAVKHMVIKTYNTGIKNGKLPQ
jgi:hypothetical protein